MSIKLTDFIIYFRRYIIYFNDELIFGIGFNVADNISGLSRFFHVFIDLLQDSLQSIGIM